MDYYNSILLHNYFFSDTAYSILGFHQSDGKFLTILKQPFVESTTPTDLQIVKKFLISKGFIHKKNNDYFHPELGIIVEDLHDENVLTNNGTLFFVDTVFFLTDWFFK